MKATINGIEVECTPEEFKALTSIKKEKPVEFKPFKSIKHKSHKKRGRKPNNASTKWTSEENRYVKENYGKTAISTMKQHLGRSSASIKIRAWLINQGKV